MQNTEEIRMGIKPGSTETVIADGVTGNRDLTAKEESGKMEEKNTVTQNDSSVSGEKAVKEELEIFGKKNGNRENTPELDVENAEISSESEKIVIPPRKAGEGSSYDGKTIKVHKKEDPVFNLRNLLFLSAVLAIFGAFLFIVKYSSSDKLDNNLIAYTFDKPSNIFSPVLSGGTPGKITFPDDVKGVQGKRCLQFTYDNDADTFIGLGTIQPDMNNFKSIKIRICSHTDRIFAVSVTELTGPVYMYVFDLKADQWTDVTATPSQFKLSGHSQDPGGRLDRDKLCSRLVIADMSGDRGIVGQNVLWMESVTIEK